MEEFVPDPDRFDWDEGNRYKNLKHGFTDKDIESILTRGDYDFAGQILNERHLEWRGLILGLTVESRKASLIFTIRADKLRPICCRAMRKIEWRLYEEEA